MSERQAMKEELEALKDQFADMEGQYRAECALCGDAGPGQGIAVQGMYARIRLLERALAGDSQYRFGGPNYDHDSTPDGV